MASPAELAAMRRAIALAAAATGSTNPNPSVGAVVLDAAGTPVGEGATRPAGGPHAEIVALGAAGDRAAGGTLVVTLEPCRHTGRTGPCTTAIADAGVSRVVIAVADPNPAAAGGAGVLQEHAIDVAVGVLAEEAARDLRPWLVATGRRRPHVTWKYAATVDGRIAAADGSSRWITGPEARVDVHRERARADAVVVGVGTVLADDPVLTVRDWPAVRQPRRVVVDSQARIPTAARILGAEAPTLVAVGVDAAPERVDALVATGAEVVRLPVTDGQLDLGALLGALFDRELLLVLVEGGATLAASFVRSGLVDRIIGYHAPLLLGAGRPVLDDIGVSTLAAGPRLRLDDVATIGGDVRITASLDGERD